MKTTARREIFLYVLLGLVILLPLVACSGGNGEESSESAKETPATETIIIGNLTDMTGVAANAMEVITMALDDLVEYYNEQNLIPGVELKVIDYDGQYDPSKDIPGYEWLKEKGADLIFTPVTGTPVTLKPRITEDRMPLFSASAQIDELYPPGYLFTVGEISQHAVYTLLEWIAENDWDYTTNGPAKIGGAGWDEPNFVAMFNAIEAYAQAHPEQFEFVGSELTPLSTFTWGPEVEALKDCDYLWPPNILTNFVREYRAAGHSAKFIGVDVHLAFLGLIRDAGLWDEIDGMLFARMSRWWNENGEIIDLTKELLYKNHPGEAEKIIRAGVGYIAMGNIDLMLDIIRKAAQTVGPENLDSEAIYEAAQSYSRTIDGVKRYSYGPTKRYPCDFYGIYRASAADEDIMRVDPQWYPTVTEP